MPFFLIAASDRSVLCKSNTDIIKTVDTDKQGEGVNTKTYFSNSKGGVQEYGQFGKPDCADCHMFFSERKIH
jgi:hypothetical protein